MGPKAQPEEAAVPAPGAFTSQAVQACNPPSAQCLPVPRSASIRKPTFGTCKNTLHAFEPGTARLRGTPKVILRYSAIFGVWSCLMTSKALQTTSPRTQTLRH
eukprot:7597879-Alexandrium_andersonii.AAC.1